MYSKKTAYRNKTVSIVLGLTASFSVGAGYPIAGIQPDRRPEGAPVLSKAVKTDGWYERALTGIEPPYPGSLRFLEDQGAWYTPFDHPGMPGRYDIRGWRDR